MSTLDLSGLEQFKSSELLSNAKGKPLQIELDSIDFDPAQPRRRLDEAALTELASTIKQFGVLQPVSLRPHPTQQSRYIVNQGERRVRACRMAGLAKVPAFIDTHCDPYSQVIENLQREELSPLDLAQFIAAREKEGYSRSIIAKKLGKSRSFITETARLIDLPRPLKEACTAGRIDDTRALYTLARLYEKDPTAVERVLAVEGNIQRQHVNAAAKPKRKTDGAAGPIEVTVANAWRVEWNGHEACLRPQIPPSEVMAIIELPDNRQVSVALKELRLIAWENT
jgi:ParB family transcriptional regulator, chromosome partitioning protein